MGKKRKFQGNQFVSPRDQAKKPKFVHNAKNILRDNVVYTIETGLIDKKTKEEMGELNKYLVTNNSTLFEEKLFLTSEKFDKKRKQINFDNFISKVKGEKKEYFNRLLEKIRALLVSHISIKYPGFTLSTGNILMSLPGGNTQSWHDDFIEDANYNHTPLVFFMGLSTCRLDLYIDSDTHKQTKPLKLGDLLTFDGFTHHRGCKYSETNFRFHWYAVHEDDKIENIGEDTFILVSKLQ